MKRTFNTLNIVTCAMLSAAAVIIAMAFHHVMGTVSALFSPMHFTVFLAGILCGPWLGLICGGVAPLLSFLCSGRPPFPDGLIPMFFELATYGFLSGLLQKVFLKNPKTNRFSSVLALAISMIAGRFINAIFGAVILAVNGSPFFAAFGAKFLGNFTGTWAGIIIQIVFIPAIMFALQKSGVLLKYLPDAKTDGKEDAVSSEKLPAETDTANE